MSRTDVHFESRLTSDAFVLSYPTAALRTSMCNKYISNYVILIVKGVYKSMWDVFISHASEDKENVVRPIAKQLSEVYKVKVWYDEFSLEYGDSLLASIEKGIQNSNFGIVILSKDFFIKTWTDHEYTSLRNKEMLLNKMIIIPIWYEINKTDVAKYSLTLSDKLAIQLTGGFDVDEIAIKLVKIIRTDIYENIIRMQAMKKLIDRSHKTSMNIEELSEIPTPPVRHKSLTMQMKARLKLIHKAINEVDSRSYNKYEEDFRRSVNIDREMIITELLTAAFLDCISIRKMSPIEKKFIYVLTLSLGNYTQNSPFNKDELEIFKRIISSYLQNVDAQIVMEYKFDITKGNNGENEDNDVT